MLPATGPSATGSGAGSRSDAGDAAAWRQLRVTQPPTAGRGLRASSGRGGSLRLGLLELPLHPEQQWVTAAAAETLGAQAAPRLRPWVSHGDTAPTSPKHQHLQRSTTLRRPFPTAAAKNNQHRLLAATAVLNIAGIDRAAGPAARESGRGARPPQCWGRPGARAGNPNGNSPSEHGGSCRPGLWMWLEPPGEPPNHSAGVP